MKDLIATDVSALKKICIRTHNDYLIPSFGYLKVKEGFASD